MEKLIAIPEEDLDPERLDEILESKIRYFFSEAEGEKTGTLWKKGRKPPSGGEATWDNDLASIIKGAIRRVYSREKGKESSSNLHYGSGRKLSI
jgi:hypothetical protein